MQHLYTRAKTRFPEVKDALDLVKVPTSVKEAEHIMQEDLKLKESLVNRLAEAELSIDHFLDVLRHQHDQGSLEISLGTKDYITMMSSLKGMLEDIRNSQTQFDEFWGIHKARVDHMMRMCHFNRSTEKVRPFKYCVICDYNCNHGNKSQQWLVMTMACIVWLVALVLSVRRRST